MRAIDGFCQARHKRLTICQGEWGYRLRTIQRSRKGRECNRLAGEILEWTVCECLARLASKVGGEARWNSTV
jgi:hypothetical protein